MNHVILILLSENVLQLQVIREQLARIDKPLILGGRATRVHPRQVVLEASHGPVEEAAHRLVIVLLVGRSDHKSHRVVGRTRLHGAYSPCGTLAAAWARRPHTHRARWAAVPSMARLISPQPHLHGATASCLLSVSCQAQSIFGQGQAHTRPAPAPALPPRRSSLHGDEHSRARARSVPCHAQPLARTRRHHH